MSDAPARPLQPGDRAPDFTVDTTDGPRSLEALLANGPLVLAFYFEDATPTCSTQVATFRDEYATLRDLGANVLALSADPLESHRSFAERLGGVPFPLGSDPDLEVARAYGVVDDEDQRRSRRAVFVIDPDGTIRDANDRYQPAATEQFAAVFRALGLDS